MIVIGQTQTESLNCLKVGIAGRARYEVIPIPIASCPLKEIADRRDHILPLLIASKSFSKPHVDDFLLGLDYRLANAAIRC